MMNPKIRAMVEANIAKTGWAVQGVFPNQDCPSSEGNFAYTIGLADKGLPELICTANLNLHTLGAFLNPVAQYMVDNVKLPTDLEPLLQFNIGEKQARFKLVLVNNLPAACDKYMVQAKQYYPNLDIAYQLLVADGSNILPGEEFYDDNFTQPVL